jgi:hypothetical protein
MLRGAPLRVDCPWVGRRHGRGGEVSMIQKRDQFRKRIMRRVKGRIAQVVEQLTLNQRVVGSSPTAPTNNSWKFNVKTAVILTPIRRGEGLGNDSTVYKRVLNRP